jgi:hypothetical protein
MLSATCNECGTAGQFLPFLAGQRVKCKACKSGWVQLPPPDFVPLPKLPPVATLIPPAKAKLVEPPPDAPPAARRATDAPPAPEWKPKHTARPDPNDPVKPDPPGGPAIPEPLADTRGASGCLVRIGVGMIVVGLASSVLWFAGIHFKILAFLDPVQPAAGLMIGGTGAVLLLLRLLKG